MPTALRPAVVALAAALALALWAAPAFATVTASSVSAPVNGTVLTVDANAGAPVHFAGTTDGNGADQVDLNCYHGNTFNNLMTHIPVNPDGTFVADVPANAMLNNSPGGPCVARAVPKDSTTSEPPGSPSAFAGPTIVINGSRETRISGGANNGALRDYYLMGIQSQGAFDLVSTGDCGIYDGYLWDPTTLAQSDVLFYCNDGLQPQDGSVASPDSLAPTGAELRVDGHNSEMAGALSGNWNGVPSYTLSGFPPLTWTKSIDPSTGDVTITESDEPVMCSPDSSTFPPTTSSCTSFVSTGVRLDRTIVQNHAGRLALVRDRWSSIDGQSHQLGLELENDQYANGSANHIGFLFPWLSSTFQSYGVGTLPGPPSGAGRMYVASDTTAADGDTAHGRGVIVFSTAPSNERFIYVPPTAGLSYFLANYTATVPASGSYQLAFGYGHAFTQADATALGDAAQAAFTPTVTLTAPAKSATQQVTVSGTASDAAGLASLSVNGKPVSVGSGGSWSTTLTLAPGSNAITAHAVNVYGVGADAHATTLTPTHGKLALSGRPKVRGLFVVFRAKCTAGGSLKCPGAALLASKERLNGRRVTGVSARKRTKTVKVGSKRFLVKGGATVTVKVPLNAAGRKLLRRFHKLPMRLTVTFTAPGAKTRVGSAKLVMRAPHKKTKH